VDSDTLDAVMEQVKALVYYGLPLNEAIAKVAKMARLTDSEGAEVRSEYDRQARKYVELTDPRVLKANARIESWYTGPDFDGAWCWPPYKKMLHEKWTPTAIAKLDESSTKILAHLSHPGKDFATRGLVVGYVQSGKTANYSALISKAADVGYKLFIVLAGTTSGLRQQTQRRLEKDILSKTLKRWDKITDANRDFGYYPGVAESKLNPENKQVRILGVVKKNKDILTNLRDFLHDTSYDIRAKCPVLLIDDEADNASVNTSTEKRTAINRLIIEILGKLPRAAYVGYTATPFANVFIDPTSPEDLFPRDFIFDLPRPEGYFGAEKIFGRNLLWFDEKESTFEGLDIIRRITDDEQRLVQPPKGKPAARASFEPEVPGSLRKAVAYFLLATACRYARGQVDHSSMLVHTTQYVHLHARLETRLVEVLSDFKANWTNRKDELRKLWDEECKYTRELAAGVTDFDSVARRLPDVLERCKVVVDNGYSSSRLEYPEGDPKVFIAIGGNTLSRGLTLEGLIVSYFVRVASAYDTLLQMGRWFGYRFEYEDLPRLWMTNELEEYFFFLAEVEEEIRRDIERLEKQGKTPRDLAIRVRTHPKLQITAKNKMGKARVTSASYSDQRLQSFLFKHEDSHWLTRNLEAGRTLCSNLIRGPGLEERGSAVLFREVDAEHIVRFLKSYSFHEDHEDLRTDLLVNYIDRERQLDALKTWNVAVMRRGTSDPKLGTVDLKLGSPVACISRSRFGRTVPCNIKALTSASDRIVDLSPIGGEPNEKAMIAARNDQAPGVGLLLLYPISKDSTPLYPGMNPRPPDELCNECGVNHLIPPGVKTKRHPLQAVEHVLGAALVFPRSAVGDANYLSLDIAALLEPDPDEVEEEDLKQAELPQEVQS
jgi:hypothetical protein